MPFHPARVGIVSAVMVLLGCPNTTGLPGTGVDAGRASEWKISRPDPDVANWRSVWAERPSLAWAVGDDGAIIRFDGTNWTRVDSATAENLESVWARGESDIWAVGWNGTILHSTGAEFSAVPSPTTEHLFGVHGDHDSIYMVGARGVILTLDADGGVRDMLAERTIREFPVCENRVNIDDAVNAICVANPEPFLLPNGEIDFDNGPPWPTCDVGNCCGDTPYFNDEPAACCYPFKCDPDGGVLRARVGVDADLKTVWVSGDYAVTCGGNGAVYKYTEPGGVGQWRKEQDLDPDAGQLTQDSLVTSWGAGSSTYCAGQDGTLLRLAGADQSWVRDTSVRTPVYLQGMWGTWRQDRWVVGFNGTVIHYNGYGEDAGWFPEDLGLTQHLRAVHGVFKDPDAGIDFDPDAGPPATRLFIVGAGGTVIQRH